eukprot:GHVS01059809.1.p1 GENE.GHVS01059809.1~~GHVS01059809.1.p1  ORF type:complete len:573 (+),score=218.85 GHVS01059809.1:214-1932(+)
MAFSSHYITFLIILLFLPILTFSDANIDTSQTTITTSDIIKRSVDTQTVDAIDVTDVVTTTTNNNQQQQQSTLSFPDFIGDDKHVSTADNAISGDLGISELFNIMLNSFFGQQPNNNNREDGNNRVGGEGGVDRVSRSSDGSMMQHRSSSSGGWLDMISGLSGELGGELGGPSTTTDIIEDEGVCVVTVDLKGLPEHSKVQVAVEVDGRVTIDYTLKQQQKEEKEEADSSSSGIRRRALQQSNNKQQQQERHDSTTVDKTDDSLFHQPTFVSFPTDFLFFPSTYKTSNLRSSPPPPSVLVSSSPTNNNNNNNSLSSMGVSRSASSSVHLSQVFSSKSFLLDPRCDASDETKPKAILKENIIQVKFPLLLRSAVMESSSDQQTLRQKQIERPENVVVVPSLLSHHENKNKSVKQLLQNDVHVVSKHAMPKSPAVVEVLEQLEETFYEDNNDNESVHDNNNNNDNESVHDNNNNNDNESVHDNNNNDNNNNNVVVDVVVVETDEKKLSTEENTTEEDSDELTAPPLLPHMRMQWHSNDETTTPPVGAEFRHAEEILRGMPTGRYIVPLVRSDEF